MVPPASRPLLSVVIPCFNEAATILDLIERVRCAPVSSKQIIVVDDGSSDGTRELLADLRADDLTVLMHERNQGKGPVLPQREARFVSFKMLTLNMIQLNIRW
ncbi:MAG: glycosyltransferase family 2 protein [Vulcanococcus sp.]